MIAPKASIITTSTWPYARRRPQPRHWLIGAPLLDVRSIRPGRHALAPVQSACHKAAIDTLYVLIMLPLPPSGLPAVFVVAVRDATFPNRTSCGRFHAARPSLAGDCGAVRCLLFDCSIRDAPLQEENRTECTRHRNWIRQFQPLSLRTALDGALWQLSTSHSAPPTAPSPRCVPILAGAQQLVNEFLHQLKSRRPRASGMRRDAQPHPLPPRRRSPARHARRAASVLSVRRVPRQG